MDASCVRGRPETKRPSSGPGEGFTGGLTLGVSPMRNVAGAQLGNSRPSDTSSSGSSRVHRTSMSAGLSTVVADESRRPGVRRRSSFFDANRSQLIGQRCSRLDFETRCADTDERLWIAWLPIAKDEIPRAPGPEIGAIHELRVTMCAERSRCALSAHATFLSKLIDARTYGRSPNSHHPVRLL